MSSDAASGGISGVVLAGGRSSRFGRDKLAEPFGDATLLDRAVDALAGLCTEVIVVIGAAGPEPVLAHGSRTVRVVRDPEPGRGPLLGLATGLDAATEPIILVAGGDMPGLLPGVLQLLAAQIGAGAAAAVLEDGDRPRPLPAALNRAQGLAVARASLAAGRASLRAALAALDAVAVPVSTWRELDPEGLTIRDVDRPEDLADVLRAGSPDAVSPPGEPRC